MCFMLRMIKIGIIVLGVILQLLVVVLYGFVNTQIPMYTYVTIFLVCCVVIHHFLGSVSTS